MNRNRNGQLKIINESSSIYLARSHYERGCPSLVKGDRLRKALPKVKQLAYEKKEVAYAIIEQAILDEDDIGQTSIWIAYHSEDMARYLWEIADRGELANPLHVKIDRSRNGPMTRRELTYELRIRGSTVARHLLQLKKKGSLEETMSGARFGRK